MRLKYIGVDTGYCRVHYQIPIKDVDFKVYCCFQEEQKGYFICYRFDGEPSTSVKPSPGFKFEVPIGGDTPIEQRLKEWLIQNGEAKRMYLYENSSNKA